MKQFVLTAIILTTHFFLAAQKISTSKTEILLAGSMHHIPDSQRQNWNSYKAFLEKYKPDAICVEFRMPSDTASLMHADGERYLIVLDSLRKAWAINLPDEKDRIKELYSMLRLSEDWSKRLELYQLLYINADFANAAFQAWRVYSLVSVLPEKEIEGIISGNPVYKRIVSQYNRSKNNEYVNVVFPLAVQFNIEYVYPVDDWTYNLKFSIAYQGGYDAVKDTKYEAGQEVFWKNFTKTEKEEIGKGNVLMFVNSAKWQKKSNYGQTILYKKTGNQHFKDYVQYWNLRNKKVGENVLHAIEGKGHKRVVVIMGYMHIPNMKKHLKLVKGIVLKTISDW